MRPTLSDRFYTPTLIRPDNHREDWVMSHKLALTVPLHWRARCWQLRCSSGVGATIYTADAPA
jgi:hypothetical protein